MADEQYRWLDRETAERLLSGEPLEAVDGDGRGQAERLARTLGALSASPPPTSEELPGEAAAVAAFRKARAEGADTVATRAVIGGEDVSEAGDAGLVRIGTPRGSGSAVVGKSRWARPARLALAAAVAVGMVGGVAVAAGTGVLGAPFGGDEPDPGASVSAAVTPTERPLVSPSPSDAVPGGRAPGDDTEGDTSAGGTGGAGRDEARGDTTPKPDSTGRPDDDREKIVSACRDLREGKRLDDDRRRALRDAAGGTRVWKYCKGVRSGTDPRSAERNGESSGNARHKNWDRTQGSKQDKAGRNAGKRAGKTDDDEDRGWSRQSLVPLRPAVSHSVKNFWPRV
ncbi:hypothetical protein [Streptomyces sp. NPDC002788]